MIEFKLRGQRVQEDEKEYLKSIGCKWCGHCKKALPEDLFYASSIRICKPCKKKCSEEDRKKDPDFAKRWRKENPNKIKQYKEKDRPNWPSQCKKYREKHKEDIIRKKKEVYWSNPEKYREEQKRRRKEKPEIYKNFPSIKKHQSILTFRRKHVKKYRVMQMLRNAISRIKNGRANRRTLNIFGIKDLNDFICYMGKLCNNENWFIEDYQIDHIWQVNWFDYDNNDPSIMCSILNNITNLRPLKTQDNLERSKIDFSPLKQEDFPKYEPYLKPEIREKIRDYFNNV